MMYSTVNYHDTTVLPNDNELQYEVNNLVKYAEKHLMKVNEDKTKIMIFNNAKIIDVTPRLTINGVNVINVVEEAKLLGVMLNSDMNWSSQTKYLTSRGYKRLWIIRRLKILGAQESDLIDVYKQQIRSVLELNCPVWQPGLTKKQKHDIERVQKVALSVIRGSNNFTYEENLLSYNIENLQLRREGLCLKFALNAYKSEKYNTWFEMNTSKRNTRSEKLKLKSVHTRTKRYQNSPLPYLTNILNLYLKEKKRYIH